MTRTFFVFEKSYTCISQGKRVANCPIFLSHQAAFSLYKCVTDRVYDTIQHAARPRFQWHLSLHFAWPIFGDSDIREIWPQVWSSVSTRSTSFAVNIYTVTPTPCFSDGPWRGVHRAHRRKNDNQKEHCLQNGFKWNNSVEKFYKRTIFWHCEILGLWKPSDWTGVCQGARQWREWRWPSCKRRKKRLQIVSKYKSHILNIIKYITVNTSCWPQQSIHL